MPPFWSVSTYFHLYCIFLIYYLVLSKGGGNVRKAPSPLFMGTKTSHFTQENVTFFFFLK